MTGRRLRRWSALVPWRLPRALASTTYRSVHVTVARDAGNADIEAAVLALDAIKRALDGKAPKKVIIIPQRIVNVVA